MIHIDQQLYAHTDWQSVWVIRIADPYVHTIVFLLTSPFPTDQKSPYTLKKFTYTIEDQIRFQTALNGSNLH